MLSFNKALRQLDKHSIYSFLIYTQYFKYKSLSCDLAHFADIPSHFAIFVNTT